ncbi:MDR family MFS transporter [Lacticaseibacillus pabuli]|uniref:MDR family MFS transporter n=1 Tax=Lacticaseibacillus pabuli TaxID=3025672 RepID=A0ABY7WW59_9LACO|nr:MDR family MFS transporter [Lacticaseibacillus sp. KACC 23028]WDF83226.1 MDR family MFS transporter [Lacticaseibacillus sp. KACC 23028]
MDTTKSEPFSLKKVIPMVLTIAAGMLLVMMDTTIMNIALPTLQHHFNTNLATAQWCITAYTFALAAVTPLSGWLSDRLTAKRAFAGAIVLFTIFSFMCTLSTSISMMITFRALQGLAGGIVGPVGMALSWQVVPTDKRGALMGLLGLPMVVAPIVGPLLCGWLLKVATWHAIFFINIPIGILSLILIEIFIPLNKTNIKDPFDWRGMLLGPSGFLSLLYAIHRLSNHGLSDPLTSGLFLLGIVLVGLFYFNELHQPKPLMAVQAFKSGQFTRGISVSWLNQIVFFGVTLLVPLFLQTAKGFTALHAGEMIIPQALASFVGMIIGGQLFDRWGIRAVALPGIAVMAGGVMALTQLTSSTTSLQLIFMIIAVGLGQGMTTMQISTYNLSVAPKNVVTRITPMINSTQQIVNSLAVVLLTNVLTKNIKHAMSLHATSMAMMKSHVILAYGHTFIVPLCILVASWLMVLTLTKPKEQD